MADYDDIATLLAARSDPRAFEVFYCRHALAVEHWLRGQVGDREVATELTAETFACALAGLERFRGAHQGSGVAWLYGIANNQVRQYHRRNRVESEWRRKIGMSVRTYDLPKDDESLERAAAVALRGDLESALASLPENQRTVVALRIIDGLSHAEIAAYLDITVPAARARVSRALRSLRLHFLETS